MRKTFFIALIFLALLFPVFGVEETLVTIADASGIAYGKPEVKISPSGPIYVAFEAKNESSGRSDIYLYKYQNKDVSQVGNVSNSSAFSYEPEMDIGSNGTIHIAWVEQSGSTHVIKYRSLAGSSWSGITTMGQVTDTDLIEDLRIAVDPAGNVFVVFMNWPQAQCYFISKYGAGVNFEGFPLSGRSKHPDVAVNSGYVHICWQYRYNREYTIAYQRRANSQNSNWETWKNLDAPAAQRPRMSLDGSGVPHIVYFEDFDSSRNLWYTRLNGSSFGSKKIVSDPSRPETYHYCDIDAVNSDNLIVTMQKGGYAGGQRVNYNWLQNGHWSGFATFSKTYSRRPAKQSVDLNPGSFFAVVAFAQRNDAVHLILAEDEGSSGGGGDAPTARFTFSPQTGKAPLDVTFDASESSDDDGNITSYHWDFGDGQSGTGLTAVHRYAAEGTYTITLTVTDNDGDSGSATQQILVEKPNQPPVAHFTFSPVNGLFPLEVNFDASASSDPDGTIAEYEWSFGGEQSGSGRTITHTFNDVGVHKVILSVYDNDGDSSTASGTVEVLGLLPPLNIQYETITNRNLFTIEYVAQVTWDRNPANAALGSNVTQYNIYRKRSDEVAYSILTTVAAEDSNTYYDRIGTEDIQYQYKVTALDDQGRESALDLSSNRTYAPPHDEPGRKFGTGGKYMP